MKSSEQKLFDSFTFVLGIVLGALGVCIAALTANAVVRSGHVEMNEESLQATADRVAPIGRIVLAGDASLNVAVQATAAPSRVDTILSGPQVFNEACYICHSPPGVPGAPVVGDAAVWGDRVAQGVDTLYEHAVNGYQGAAGFMPAKGGRVDLSDDEVRSAVDYMLEQL